MFPIELEDYLKNNPKSFQIKYPDMFDPYKCDHNLTILANY